MGQYIGPQCSCWPLHKIRNNTLVRVTATIMGLPWYITLRHWKPSRGVKVSNKETYVKIEYYNYSWLIITLLQYILIDVIIICSWKYITIFILFWNCQRVISVISKTTFIRLLKLIFNIIISQCHKSMLNK